MPLFALTIYWHWSLKEPTDHGHKSTECTFVDDSLLKGKYYLKIIMVRANSGMKVLA